MVIEAVALYTLAVVFGGMLFFSGVFSPLVFAKLPAATAGAFIRAVFPWYFLVTAALLGLAGLALIPSEPGWAGVMLAMAALGALNREVLMPRINTLRDAELAGDKAAGRGFHRLHMASVAINLVQILAAALALAVFL